MAVPRLTIGMATCDDFDGVYFTLTSLMIHHPEVMGECEFVVVDNNPQSRQGIAVREWIAAHVPNGRYVSWPAPFGTAPARNEVFRQARGEFVLCLDCHVLIVAGAIRRLLDYFTSNPACADLLMGPLLLDHGEVAATHQQPEWGGNAWGVWSLDDRGLNADGDPFEIWQQGMGLFACRKEAWVEFHPDFRGFGGCETYVMEKVRRRGGRVLCCPWLRWTHRFPRPLGVPYRVARSDTLRNYLIGFNELGLDTEPVLRHFTEQDHNRSDRCREEGSVVFGNSIAILGEPQFGSVKMRGNLLARHFRCALTDPRAFSVAEPWDIAIAVKSCSRAVRNGAKRLVYDPLDAFWNEPDAISPHDFWRRQYADLQFDDVIATSPACAETMREALPRAVQIHLIPHQADKRIDETWFNRNGPVVYAGQPEFIAQGLDRIREACRLIGKDFVTGTSCKVLQGASLVLALRLPPFNTPVNRLCKPQVKIANAVAANIPVVATDCPAATSLYPQIETVSADFSPRQLAEAMSRAADSQQTWKPFRDDDFVSAVHRLLGWPAWIVFTASFGNGQPPCEPEEREAGVQYLCFTDNPHLRTKTWALRTCARSRNPLMQAKACKLLVHESFDCDASLWIDAGLQLQSLEGAFRELSNDVALRRHASRNCIYDEALYCKMSRRGDPRLIDRTIENYTGESHPPQYGLWDTDVILRRHNEFTKSFNLAWWREVSSGTPHDQLSLPVILRRLSVPLETLPQNRPRTSARFQ